MKANRSNGTVLIVAISIVVLLFLTFSLWDVTALADEGGDTLHLPLVLMAGPPLPTPTPTATTPPTIPPTATPTATNTPVEAWPQISLTPVVSGLDLPVHVTHAGDGSGRLFVVEQRGRIRIVENGILLDTPFLDIQARVRCCGERGLLSIVFPPDFDGSGHFYVDYTLADESGALDGATRVSRFQVSADPNRADADSEQIVLQVPQPYTNHNGGQLAFGPDGYLYVGMGDGGNGSSGPDPQNNGQRPDTLLGKLLRIDVESGAPLTYTIPADNPFIADDAYRDEIWALGLRNPWRFSFDRQSGDLYVGDVGQNRWEEVDVQSADSMGGENYGWRIMEGSHCFAAESCDTRGLVLPVWTYSHDNSDRSITGGFVYRGPDYPRMQGIYFYADFISGRIWGLRRNGDVWENRLLLGEGWNYSFSSFGEDEAGALYAAHRGNGTIYRVIDSEP